MACTKVGQNHFIPSPSDAFYSYFSEECEQHFIHILITCTLDMGTGGNLKRWRQRLQETQATIASNCGRKITSCWRAERQELAVQRKICEEVNSQRVKLSHEI